MDPRNAFQKMSIRCYGYRTGHGTWIASCIDLTLMGERPSREESLQALHEQILLYVQSVLDTEDKESISYLLPRPAPLKEYVIYYLIGLAVRLRSLFNVPVFRERIPLPESVC